MRHVVGQGLLLLLREAAVGLGRDLLVDGEGLLCIGWLEFLSAGADAASMSGSDDVCGRERRGNAGA